MYIHYTLMINDLVSKLPTDVQAALHPAPCSTHLQVFKMHPDFCLYYEWSIVLSLFVLFVCLFFCLYVCLFAESLVGWLVLVKVSRCLS